MAIGPLAPPAADENNTPKATCQTPFSPHSPIFPPFYDERSKGMSPPGLVCVPNAQNEAGDSKNAPKPRQKKDTPPSGPPCPRLNTCTEHQKTRGESALVSVLRHVGGAAGPTAIGRKSVAGRLDRCRAAVASSPLPPSTGTTVEWAARAVPRALASTPPQHAPTHRVGAVLLHAVWSLKGNEASSSTTVLHLSHTGSAISVRVTPSARSHGAPGCQIKKESISPCPALCLREAGGAQGSMRMAIHHRTPPPPHPRPE